MSESTKQSAKANESRKAAEAAAQDSIQAASRMSYDAINQGSQAGEQALNATAEAARVTAQTFQETVQAGWDVASKLAQHSNENLLQVLGISGDRSRQVMQQSSDNIQAIAKTGSVLALGMQDLVREWLNFMQSRLDQNLNRLNALTTCRSLPDVVAQQSDLIRENMEEVIDKGQEIMRHASDVSQQAARVIASEAKTTPRR